MERKKKKAKDIKEEPFDYENFEKEAIAKLRAGKGLTGPDGALTGMIQRILQAALDGEMDEHIKEDRPNRRNGHTEKQVQTSMGPVDLEPPRDRDGSFDPKMYCPYDKDIFTLCII